MPDIQSTARLVLLGLTRSRILRRGSDQVEDRIIGRWKKMQQDKWKNFKGAMWNGSKQGDSLSWKRGNKQSHW